MGVLKDDSEEDQGDKRASICGTVCALYATVTVIMGTALPLTYFLSGETQEIGLYLTIFHIWLYVIALALLFYIQVCLCGLNRHNSSAGSLTTEDSVDVEALRDLNSTLPCDEIDATLPKEFYEGHDSRSVGGSSSIHDQNIVTHIVLPPPRDDPAINYHGKGVNFFLRMGLIVFGMGGVLLDGFRLLQFMETSTSIEYYAAFYIAQTGLRLLVMFAQTFFVFKNHKLVVNFKTGFIRFALLHIAATNLCIWIVTIIQEVVENFRHFTNQSGELKLSLPNAQIEKAYTTKDVTPLHHVSNQTEKTLAAQAAPYLYPCTVQFCLIVLAILFNIHNNIDTQTHPRLPTSKNNKLIGGLCHKSNTGLFFGLLLLMMTCISVGFFLLYDKTGSPLSNPVTFLVYLGGDALVVVLTFLAVLLGFCRMHKLDKSKRGMKLVNKSLLFLSLGGYILLLTFIMVPTITMANLDNTFGVLSVAQAGIYLLGLLQALIQVIFIVDGLRRSTTSRRQLKTKPGRSIVTFIMICNLAMWTANTFQMKEVHSSANLRLFYGDLAWQIVVHACFPLTNFFRFFSSVLIADIWLKAYKRKRKNSQVYKGRHDSERYV